MSYDSGMWDKVASSKAIGYRAKPGDAGSDKTGCRQPFGDDNTTSRGES